MNAGPGGFRGAPLTKALVVATVSTSIIVQAASKTARRRSVVILDSFVHGFAFKHPGELLFGALLTYYFRVLERQMGTGKYGAYTLITSALGFAIQTLIATFARRPSASGLYPLLFANMVAFYLDIPSLQRFTVLGISLSDKAFVYLAALQLILSNAQHSAAASLSGILAGLVYHSGLFGLQKLKLPKVIQDLFSATAGRIFGGPAQRQQIFVTPATAPPQQMGGVAGAGAGGVSSPRPRATIPVEPSPEAVQQLVDMGFDQGRARQALQRCNNNIEMALQQLL